MVEFVFSPITSEVFLISQIIIIIAAIFLTIITIKSYKITRFKKMIFVLLAFALFGISHTINLIDQSVVDIMSDDARYAMFGVVQVGIMAMFFMAIVKK